jgi:ribosomal protein S18
MAHYDREREAELKERRKQKEFHQQQQSKEPINYKGGRA